MFHSVLITGASRGIGKACAQRFAGEARYLFLNCRSSVDELKALCASLSTPESRCIPLPGDVGDGDQVGAMFRTLEEVCGGLEVLINNAGISHTGLLTELSDRQWDRLLATNLSSVFYTCRAAIPYMVSQKKGRILNISSVWGRSGASCEAAYSATKAGVQGLTQALAKELAPSRIPVNALALGVMDTDMNRWLSPEERKALEEAIPAGRFGTPKEAAQAVFSLCHAPLYLTGQIIGLDGGFL